jgi:hypothetical protein
MARSIPLDYNLHTPCPAAIKAKITELENAAVRYGVVSDRYASGTEPELTTAQTARYNLERTILSCIQAALENADRK